jgi:Ca-activated chloride channel family protein
VCFNKYCVGAGSLRISLAFTVDADFDLHVLTPADNEIFFANKAANGGELDVDQCISSCGSEPHVENVVFDETALSGEYQVWVVNFGARAAGDFRIEVAGDVSATFEGSLPAASGNEAFEEPESTRFTFTL